TVNGGAGNDTINGVNGASLTTGLGEIDVLSGGAGSDLFILGNTTKAYYDDGNTLTNGSNDYADITDLNIGDIIQLQGTSSNYLLAVVGADTQVLINKPNTEPDELIGIVRNQTGLSLTGTYFSYVFDNTPPTNQAPTNITLNNSTVAENQPINTKIGNFTTTDPNTGDSFTYSLALGTGDTDNNSFSIVGNNELQTNSVFDYETKNSYSIRVKTTDQGGLSYEKELTININDLNEITGNPLINNGRNPIVGTAGSDYIIGGPGAKTISGGLGNDFFVFTNLRDVGQRITDFTMGEDKIVLTQLLSSINYNGADPIADQYMRFVAGTGSNTGSTFLQIDRDGISGSSIFKNFLQVDNITTTQLNNVNNFVF
ncbi:cadherin domain-containing protein, partial [Dolichospermum compactum]